MKIDPFIALMYAISDPPGYWCSALELVANIERPNKHSVEILTLSARHMATGKETRPIKLSREGILFSDINKLMRRLVRKLYDSPTKTKPPNKPMQWIQHGGFGYWKR